MPNIKKHKKKLSPMLWEDVRVIKFTDKQWEVINRRFQLPNEARLLIESNVSLYKFHESNHAGYPTRSATLSELKTMLQTVKRLSLVFDSMGARSWYALIDTANTDWKNAREIWLARIEAATKITVDVSKAIQIVQHQKPGKSGPHSFAIDHLVEQLDKIVYRYKKTRIDRGQVYVDFILKVANVADPEITSGTIDAALKRIIKNKN